MKVSNNTEIQKTDTFFLISNYNHDPAHLLEYCNDYIVYDQSASLRPEYAVDPAKFVRAKHSGHNLSDYFSFFIANYDNLPEHVALIKGNLYPRHLSKDFFDRVFANQYYTFLFEAKPSRIFLRRELFANENTYLEINNSWYVYHNPHYFFQSYNELINFIYVEPSNSSYILFSPGACYILPRNQILKNPKEIYCALLYLTSYTDPVNPFPSEAHQVERMCHFLYSANYRYQRYTSRLSAFKAALTQSCERKKLTQWLLANPSCRRSTFPSIVDTFILTKMRKALSRLLESNSMKVLVLGVHSWRELRLWGAINSTISVLGVGILDILGDVKGASNTFYIKAPLHDFVQSIGDNEKFDLIVYEGYFLKEDAKLLGILSKKVLGIGGEMWVFDVLRKPTTAMLAIQKYANPIAGITVSEVVYYNIPGIQGHYWLRYRKSRHVFGPFSIMLIPIMIWQHLLGFMLDIVYYCRWLTESAKVLLQLK